MSTTKVKSTLSAKAKAVIRKSNRPSPPYRRFLFITPIQEFIAGKLSEKTRQAYRSDIASFLTWLNGGKKDILNRPEDSLSALLNVDMTMVCEYRDAFLANGLAPASVARKMSVLGGVYNALKSEGLLEKNPFSAERTKRPRVSAQGKTAAFSKEQIRAILALPDMDTFMGARDKVLFLMLLYLGLRREEILHIKVTDFYETHGHRVVRINSKGGKIDTLKVPPKLWVIIQKKFMEPYKVNGYLFTNSCQYDRSEYPITGSRLYYLVQGYLWEAGIDTAVYSVHSFRATAIILSLDGGASIRQTQLLARHAEPKTTMRYYHNLNSLEDNAVDYIDFDAGDNDAPDGNGDSQAAKVGG